MQVTLLTLTSALTAISNGAGDTVLSLSQSDKDLLMSDVLWLPSERARAARLVEQCCFGSLDALGLQRFQLPAEWIASVIAHFVEPINWQVAAFSLCNGTIDLDQALGGEIEPVKAEKLYSMVLLASGGIDKHRSAFEARTAVKMRMLGL